MKKALGLFTRSGLGAALGAAVYMLITCSLVGGLNIYSLLMSMLCFGAAFGVISALVHSFCNQSVVSSILSGVVAVAVVGGLVMVSAGTGGIPAAMAAHAIQAIGALGGLSVMLGIGGYLGMRVVR